MKIWLAVQESDHPCYNQIARNKKEILLAIQDLPTVKWEEVLEIEVDCSNVFNLIDRITGEGGGRNAGLGKVLQKFTVPKIDGKFYLDRQE